MTLISPTIKFCAVCRMPKPMMQVVSVFSMETKDLDGRCGHVDFMFMEQCWWCGYCNPDLSASVSQKTRDFVKSDDYRWHTKRSDLPGLARTFQCYSILCEHAKNWLDSGHASLVAAWACDDWQHYLGSEYSRRRAVPLLSRLLDPDCHTTKFISQTCLVLADIHRRLGEFDNAMSVLDQIAETSDIEARIRAMETHLIAANDTKRYNIKDIPGDLPAESGENRFR